MIPLLIATDYVRPFVDMARDPGGRTAGFEGEPQAASDGGFLCDVLKVGSTAVIPICGPIDYRVSFWSRWGLMTSSQAVRADFARLMNDSDVSRIVFDIDSPGGVYSGLPEVARDVFRSRGTKETVAVANPMAASGALWLGASAERFFVLGSGQVGSLGALMLHMEASRFFDEQGITFTILRDPPGKADFNPFETLSEESRDHHQGMINAIADEFRGAIARFRGVSKAKAASDFGEGRMLNAREAVDAGLVDGIVDSVESVLAPRVRSQRRTRLNPRLELERRRAFSGTDRPTN